MPMMNKPWIIIIFKKTTLSNSFYFQVSNYMHVGLSITKQLELLIMTLVNKMVYGDYRRLAADL
jgi:hypothetical protein